MLIERLSAGPELIASFIMQCKQDYRNVIWFSRSIYEDSNNIEESLQTNPIIKLKPLETQI